jgi:heme/copper-type cytochrome/quinol oxidase subunit 3
MSETLFESSGFVAGTRPGGALTDNSRFLFLIGLAIDVMLFAGIIGAYFVLRGGTSTWPTHDFPLPQKNLAAMGTLALGLASIFLGVTLYAQHRNALRTMWTALMASLFFLTTFLALNGVEWKLLFSDGLPLRSVLGGMYLIMTGAFHLQIVGCLLYVLATYRRTLRWRHYTRSSLGIAHLSYFISAMFLVWIGIYSVVYL